ncbi:CE1759 family FMN reductase [Arachnia propionica]|uniref:NADPH-dependent FMN reductase n=1 Tax=Arachnia propionica TaxID=1750 RepID=A0A3P1WT81_9ACTN|nr:CE1759 family FMN reductase [Arachnia propionica]RRD49505.1 NADPH-dependent FMN reductase [Arachnia propionica]
MTRFVVIHAGLRVPSTTKLLADGFAAALAEQESDEVRVISLRDHAHAIVDAMLTGLQTEALTEVIEEVAAAEALVVVTPTFSASYSGLFKSFVDILEPGILKGRPVVLAATGGTARHSLMLDFALRPLLSYLGALPARTGVFAATEDFGGAAAPQVQRRIQEAVSELRSMMSCAPQRQVRDEYDDVAPFEDLLRGLGRA